jgi:hypothetical protein
MSRFVCVAPIPHESRCSPASDIENSCCVICGNVRVSSRCRWKASASVNSSSGCRRRTMARFDDLVRFYEILGALEHYLGGTRTLGASSATLKWPTRGVYFFFEGREDRSDSGRGARVVRVGTHALTTASRTTLWNRLSQHRGTLRSGRGNHHGSIFRLLAGEALMRRDSKIEPATWGRRGSPTERWQWMSAAQQRTCAKPNTSLKRP